MKAVHHIIELKEFYLNYKECKFEPTLYTLVSFICFILTIRNVNKGNRKIQANYTYVLS